MPDLNNKPDGDGLEDLRPTDRKETEDIIKEIADAAPVDKPTEKPEPTPEPKKPEEKPADVPKEEPKDDDKPKEKSRKDVKLMPTWVHKAAEDEWKKKEEALQKELEVARQGSIKPKEVDAEKPQSQLDADLRKKTDAIAEKYGTDPDEEYDRAVLARSQRADSPKVEIPKEITDSIEDVKKWRQDQQLTAEENHFKSDFDSQILPLVKAEYGDDVPQSTIDEIKDSIKAKAYTEEYGKVPLKTIYKGEDEFRGLIPAKQRGSEKSRGGYQASEEPFKADELDLTKEQPDDVVEKMTPEQFDTYSNNMGRKK